MTEIIKTIPNAGSIVSFTKNTLTVLDNVTTDYGPAASTTYAPHRIALAHYAGGSVSVFDTSNPQSLVELQSFHYTMTVSGPNTTLQDKPYIHGVTVDPSGEYLIALDRGADMIRIYAVGWDSRLLELDSFAIAPGTGPRHGVFVTGVSKTFLYVLGELTNSLLGFEVLYAPNGRSISFREFYNDSTYQSGYGDASGIALPSEIVLSGKRHLIISVRNDPRQRYLGQESDTIVTYEVDLETGCLRLVQLAASGGKWPRSFAVSADGGLILVGNQYSAPESLYLFGRDPETGIIEDEKALAQWTTDVALQDGGSISSIIWDDLSD